MPAPEFFPELVGCALIRELHVYGKMKGVGIKKEKEEGEDAAVQHFGFGSKLIQEAERITYARGFRKIAVISGVGVRDYYRKKGYLDDRHYLIKKLEGNDEKKRLVIGTAVASFLALAGFLYLQRGIFPNSIKKFIEELGRFTNLIKQKICL